MSFNLAHKYGLSDLAIVDHNSRGWSIAIKGEKRDGMSEKRIVICVYVAA